MFEFFVTPPKLLDLPDQEPAFSPVMDVIACHEFYRAVSAIAFKYDLDYMTTRAKLVELYKAQETFSFYGICRHAFSERGYAAEALTALKEERRSHSD
jgi:hypothetical protein